MNETTLASLRAKLEEIRTALMGEVKNNIQSKKDKPNEQVADIADDAAQSYDRQLMMEIGEQEWKKTAPGGRSAWENRSGAIRNLCRVRRAYSRSKVISHPLCRTLCWLP